ncbi:MAG TPA: ExeM/NucH family extracellular endonuclease, partial [Burkholderiaceae bacterium]
STPCSAAQQAQIVDLVGYGATANYSEGSPAPAPSSITAIFRAGGGCTDANNNANDFATGTPAPRNSLAAPVPCAGTTPPPPPPPPAPPTAAIWQIQGSGAASPYVGQVVTTTGVVTKVDNNGFFMQDLNGDGNPATSDGIFAFTGSAPAVSAGQMVQVTGTVQEFNVGAAGNTDTAAHTVTELGSITNVTVTGSGYTIAPVQLSFPLPTQNAMEAYEGMLVTLSGPLTVQQNYFLGRSGELTLAAGGRLWNPTNVYRPGAQAQALNTDNIRRTILLDDGTSVQNPNPTPYLAPDNTVRAGDTVASVTGVVDYGLTTSANTDPGAYKIHPTQPVTFARANPRTTMADDVGGNLRIGSANVENFFTTLNDGSNKCPPSNTADDCRGANNAAEFTRQRTKVVEELVGMNADAVALMELQNNGATAIQNLVDALNARLGATVYARVPFAATGGGTDAIQVGMIYQPSRLSLVGAALSDTAAINNRAPMAQTFAALNGEKFTLIANHLKSKGCSDFAAGPGDADSGDLQGCFNARRVQQADELRSFVAQVQSASGVSDTLLVGDFNAYAKEDPIADLTSNGFIDQIGRFLDVPGANSYGYSYVFNGSSGRLDHAIANNTLSPKVTGVTEWHINADEPLVIDYNQEFKQPACATCGPDDYTPTPYRASDHDPIVLGLNLVHVINGTAANDTLVGTPGDDVITGGTGSDRLTGNGGRDVFVYTSMRDAGDTITDFTPGDDRLDLTALLAGIGATPATAWANGVVTLAAAGNNTVVLIDTDGKAGAAARPLVTLLNVSPAYIDPLCDLGLGTPAAVAASVKASAKAATLRTMTAARTTKTK